MKIDKEKTDTYNFVLVEIAPINKKRLIYTTVYRPPKHRQPFTQEVFTPLQNNNAVTVEDLHSPYVSESRE